MIKDVSMCLELDMRLGGDNWDCVWCLVGSSQGLDGVKTLSNIRNRMVNWVPDLVPTLQNNVINWVLNMLLG